MLTKIAIKKLKLYNQIQFVKNLLNKNKFILFFNYAKISPQIQQQLNSLLLKYNFKSIVVKKTVLKFVLNKEELTPLLNLLQGNILLIYKIDNLSEENTLAKDKILIKQLIENSNLMLLGGKIDRKLYRPSDIKNLLSLDDNIQYNSLINIMQTLNKIKASILIQKYKF